MWKLSIAGSLQDWLSIIGMKLNLLNNLISKFDVSNIYVSFLLTEEIVSCCGYLEWIKFLFLHLQASSATMVALLKEEIFHCTATWVAVQALFCFFSSVSHLLFYCKMLYFKIIFEYIENITLKIHRDNVGLYVVL